MAMMPMKPPKAADALVIVTEWDAFRALDLERLKTTSCAGRAWSTFATSTRRGNATGRLPYFSVGRPSAKRRSQRPAGPKCRADLKRQELRSIVTNAASWSPAAPGSSARIFASACSRDGDEVLCVDNFFTGTRRNIAHLLDNKNFELMRHDVSFPLYVEVDQIYNLACPASPIHYQHDPVQTTKTSVHRRHQHAGPRQAPEGRNPSGLDLRGLRRSRRASADRKTIGATSTRSARAPATTKASAAPKRCSSTITASTSCGSRSRASSTPTVRACTRNDGRVVSNFIVQALSSGRITLYGDGKQTRSFCFVDDLVDGFIRLMDCPATRHRPGQPRQSRRDSPMRELAEHVIELTGSKSRIDPPPAAAGRSASQRRPDISRAMRR